MSNQERVVRAVVGGVIGSGVGVVTAGVAGGVVLLRETSYEASFVFIFGAWALGILGAAVGSLLGAVSRAPVPAGRVAAAAGVASASALAVFGLEYIVGARYPEYAGGIPTLLAFAISPLAVLGRVWRAPGGASRGRRPEPRTEAGPRS